MGTGAGCPGPAAGFGGGVECGPLVLSWAGGAAWSEWGGRCAPDGGIGVGGGVGGLTNPGQTPYTARSSLLLWLANPTALRQLPQGCLQAAVGEKLLANGLRLLFALGTDAEVGIAILEVNGELVELGHR